MTTIILPQADIAALARSNLERVSDPAERERLRRIGFPRLRLAGVGGQAPHAPSPWMIMSRDPCPNGHGDDEECDDCRGICLGGDP